MKIQHLNYPVNIENLQAIVEDNKVVKYSVNAKISFVVDCLMS